MPGVFNSSFLSNLRFILICTFVLLIFSASASAREVTLQWDPNSEPDLSHYVVLWGSSSGSYSSNSGDIGLSTSYTCSLPDDGQVYYFAVIAVNEAGLSSDYSNEVNTGGGTGNGAPVAIAGPDQNVPRSLPASRTGTGLRLFSHRYRSCGLRPAHDRLGAVARADFAVRPRSDRAGW